MSDYFLGVDGGQSSTTALIGDETGRVLGYGRGGPCNHISGPEAKARFVGAIAKAVGGALDQAGIPTPRFRTACLGFSGGAEDKAPWLDEVFTCGRRVVTHDGLIALSGATGGQPGVIIIAGTGSFAFGRDANGRTMRAGGWGYIYGDEGGGFGITRQALRAALRDEEGWGPATALTKGLLDVAGAVSANDLLHRLYTPEFARPVIASWSRLVDEAAHAGDAVARDILTGEAKELATYAAAVYHNLFQAASEGAIAYTGGVFRSEVLLTAFRSKILGETGQTTRPPLYGPAAGALLEAYREAGVSVTLSNLPEIEKS